MGNLRVSLTFGVKVGSDANYAISYFNRDANNGSSQVLIDKFTDQASGSINLPQDQSPVLLSLGALRQVYGCYLELLSGGDCTMILNGGQPQTLKVPDTGKPIQMYLPIAILSLSLAGPAGMTATGSYVMFGYSQAQP